MIFTKPIVLAASAVAALAAPLTANDSPIPGYEIVDIQWSLQAFPGGEYINVTGTVEQVVAQLTKINPDYEKNVLAAANMTRLGADAESGLWHYLYHDCLTWPVAWTRRVWEGIMYLDGHDGVPTMGPGPAACARVSCSWDSAIWWCNDDPVELQLDVWTSVAWGAYIIYRDCRNERDDQTSGQIFYEPNWNVIVRGDTC
ncbi:hypothetical protein B0T14DRAFT_565892 [Immersiella caudata]|uniref:Uncharacterized protein n=1 Tax=Immersiella caudata TaxID=314043 RepID=A0AA39WP39_9PEZI|nr:hypothetical protein B0T14DRAFT_565892 [Immersiella caudata]